MARKLISGDSPYEARAGYSRAVADGPWCFVAGTTGADPATGEMPDDAATQTRNALTRIEAALGEAGFTLADTVRARYIVADAADVDVVMAVLGEAFADIRPAATMMLAAMVDPAMKVEIEVTAYRP